MKVGFTGTQDGCTPAQLACLQAVLSGYGIEEFHHGGCVGADAQAHELVDPRVVHLHPAKVDQSKRAIYVAANGYPVKPPLVRNKGIVNAVEVLVACPKGPEELRSGTWATVRYARKTGVPVVFCWPGGSMTREPE